MGWGNIYLNDFLFFQHLSLPPFRVSLGLAAASPRGISTKSRHRSRSGEKHQDVAVIVTIFLLQHFLFLKNPLLSDSSFFIIRDATARVPS